MEGLTEKIPDSDDEDKEMWNNRFTGEIICIAYDIWIYLAWT
jgi:hypothetical protein